jgi:Leucine Rich repeat
MSEGPASRRPRKYLRFSMRSLLVLVLLIGGFMGWYVRSVRLQRSAVAAITSSGGTVEYDIQLSGASWPASSVSTWVSDRLGIDYVGNVANVWLYGSVLETDAHLASVSRLSRVERIGLTGSSVTDVGLAHLSGMINLTRLDLSYTKITDAGLQHLEDSSNLSVLILNGTRITDSGLAHLKSLGRLSEIDLADTPVTDAGLTHLKGLHNLSVVNVTNTKVTAAGMNDLKQAHSGLRVYH